MKNFDGGSFTSLRHCFPVVPMEVDKSMRQMAKQTLRVQPDGSLELQVKQRALTELEHNSLEDTRRSLHFHRGNYEENETR